MSDSNNNTGAGGRGSGGGGGIGVLAFIVGGLLVAVAVIAFFVLSNGTPDAPADSVDVEVNLPELPEAPPIEPPSLPDAPTPEPPQG